MVLAKHENEHDTSKAKCGAWQSSHNMVAGQHDSTSKSLNSSQEMLVRRLLDASHANSLSNNNKEHSSWLSDLKQKRIHAFRNDRLNEIANAALTSNEDNPSW